MLDIQDLIDDEKCDAEDQTRTEPEQRWWAGNWSSRCLQISNKPTIQPGTLIYTDEYTIYSRLPDWGYEHKTVNHSEGEYARDEDDDGFHEVHINTLEGFWSLLRSWLRPHRGISQEKLPLYLTFFEFVYNVRSRGKALLPSLLALLLSPPCFPYWASS